MDSSHKAFMSGALSNQGTQQPLYFLDGIRGFMALNVILCHFAVVYYPQMYFSDKAISMGGWLSLFALTPLSALINGDIAVRYFFVLTGFLVGRSSFIKEIQPQDILSRCMNRYIRLFPVVCVTTILTYFSMIFHLQRHHTIIDIALNGAFLTHYCDFEPSAFHLLINIVLDPFIKSSDYVAPFWTIRYEFWGYILTLIVCHILKESKFRKIWYVIVAVLCISQLSANYVPFILGAFVADILYNQNPDCFEPYYTNWIHKPSFILLCFVAGLYFSCCPMDYTSIYSMLDVVPQVTPDLVRSVGIALLLYVILYNTRIQKWFSKKIFLFFGNLSFETYALHWPIMLTLEAWLFSKFVEIVSYDVAALAAFAITLPVIYVSAYAMHTMLKAVGNKKVNVKSNGYIK